MKNNVPFGQVRKFVLACFAVVALSAATEYVLARCDSECKGVMKVGSTLCGDTSWSKQYSKCLSLTGTGGNCDKSSSASSEVDCKDCVCAPTGKALKDRKDGDSCFCKTKGY